MTGSIRVCISAFNTTNTAVATKVDAERFLILLKKISTPYKSNESRMTTTDLIHVVSRNTEAIFQFSTWIETCNM